jgi:hypothetical protein
MNVAIPVDAADDFDPTEAFMTRWGADAETPSAPDDEEETTEEVTDEDAEGEDTESEGTEREEAPDDDTEGEDANDGGDEPDEGDTEGEDKESTKTVIDSEDAVVKIKVDGQEVEASIKDLKRLYGQEAALTRKSQETAELRKKAEETGAKHVAGLEVLLNNARKQAEPYANLNFLALAKDPTITQEELTALSEAAQTAFEQVRFLETELDGVVQYHQQGRRQQLMAQARETHKLLSDPEKGLPGWGEPLYNEIRTFATEQGLPKDVVDDIVDPVGIRILHMAMQYAKGAKAVTSTKGPKKIDKSPKKIVKGETTETVKKAKGHVKDDAFKRLSKTGSTDDAAEAFLARWQ